TDVGAYAFSATYYGTFDQDGNVWEWTERLVSGSSRGLRGGAWNSNDNALPKTFYFSQDPTLGVDNRGFRVATIPEPSTVFLVLACGCVITLLHNGGRRSASAGS